MVCPCVSMSLTYMTEMRLKTPFIFLFCFHVKVTLREDLQQGQLPRTAILARVEFNWGYVFKNQAAFFYRAQGNLTHKKSLVKNMATTSGNTF